MITIVDYAINNLRSVEKAFASMNLPVEVSDDPERIRSAEKLVLPGVGAFADAMNNLQTKNLIAAIRESVRAGTPLLGLCLGLQLLFSESEEFGRTEGFRFIPGKVRRLPDRLPVPHIGWNQLHLQRSDPLLEGIREDSFVYFVHSYYAEPEDKEDVLATTDYAIEFPAIARRGNVWATQFHPEKSQDVGLRMLKNFAAM
ncbi:MAG: imidazole glycerol phosphate synthase subunit HisH [Acidobacteria bacterium]|nr:imidazole glycerol phosphate synthase subunit HisH [Acidobacteriota bacterium]MCI0624533.1 imidazole glycerol phosphate synthase subunit HisH [Acidobacteriota bacterium]MCI0720665.1 imidazole glycerol phosphate synthase subunit HisH [Acidobacteriota bacterium]